MASDDFRAAVVQLTEERDEWMRAARKAEAERDEARAALARVEALHKKARAQRRIPGAFILPPPEDICLGCSVIADEDDELDGYAMAGSVIESRPWPCSTVAALRTPDGGSDD